MLTAKHCGEAGTEFFSGLNASNFSVGTLKDWSNVSSDIELLTGSDDYEGKIFKGDWLSDKKVKVTGSSRPFVGQKVCEGGAKSGAKCGLTVTKVGGSRSNKDTSNPFDNYYNIATVENKGGGAVWGAGDSGGPVYYSYKGGVAIVGIISTRNIGSEVPCLGQPTGGSRICSSIGGFTEAYAFFEDHPEWKSMKG
jgi:hypothetical protein